MSKVQDSNVDATIAQLEEELVRLENLIIALANEWLSGKKEGRSFATGVCLLYLTYVLIGETNDKEKIMRFLQISNLPSDRWEELADKILDTYQNIARGLP